MKLNKKDISKAIQDIGIDKLLHKDIQLTSKQKKFAENIALKGMNKTQAYRDSGYSLNNTNQGLSVNANKLANNTKVSLMIDQLRLSVESEKYLLPSHLRALAVKNITEIAIDETLSARDRLKALELIAKFETVGLFSTQKEVTVNSNSEEVKGRLMSALKLAIANSKSLSDSKKKTADDLLNEIKGNSIHDAELVEDNSTIIEGTGNDNQNMTDPPYPTPQNSDFHQGNTLHNIPHKQSPTLDNDPLVNENDSQVGGTPIDFVAVEDLEPIENTPLTDLGSPTDGEDIYE